MGIFRGRGAALAVLCAGQMMIILDGTIVTVALPAIQRDLDFSPAGLAWVVNTYLIAFAGLLLLAGRLGDLVGRVRVFLGGVALFTAASALCGLAPDRGVLLVARFVQGVGGAGASAVVLGMLVTLFDEPRARAAAIGVYSFVGSAGASVGVLAGGVLTQALSWHWIFLVNVPIGLATLVLARRALRPLSLDRGEPGGRPDVLGAVLVTAALMLGVTVILTASGRSALATALLALLAFALLGAFALRQVRARYPLLPPRLLRSRALVGANAAQALMVAGLFGFQFLTALYLQLVLGFGATRVGLAFLPVTCAIAVSSLGLSARAVTRLGGRTTLLTGLAMIAAGLVALSRVPAQHGYPLVLVTMIVMGTGFGLAMPALTTLALAGVAPRDAGLASGLLNTTQQVGGALGLAILAALAATRTSHLLAGGATAATALTSGYRLAYAVAATLLAAAVLAALTIPGRSTAIPPAEISPADITSVDITPADIPSADALPAGAASAKAERGEVSDAEPVVGRG